MKLGFICLNLPGHLNPMTALARRLQDRNHDVVFLYSSGAGGLPFVSGPEKDQIDGSVPDLSKMQGEDALKFGIGLVMAQTETILKSLPAVIQANGVDALVIDTVQFYAELGAIQLGMPYIHVSNALHLDFSGYTPLCYYDWPHQTTASALARNREGAAKYAKIMENASSGIKSYVKSAGLDVDLDNPSATISKLAWITQCPPEFDFASSHWPPQFHHTGPFHDGMGREKLDFPWERLTGEPLIYASMGTILNGRLDVFRTIVAGMAKCKDLQLVLSIGDLLDPEQIGPVPKNAIIVKRAPQLELLKQTSVCITHAGLNTVLESLAKGVPQIAIPVTFDQPGVAARVAHNQTGVVTSLNKLTTDHLSTLLNEVLNDSTYRDSARELQKAIAKANGLSVAADLVETSLGVTKKADKKS
jgi:zeaxanthin glucosyltransferase